MRTPDVLHPSGFAGHTLGRLLEAFATGVLVPGGGAAAAMGGALGVSLLQMASRLPGKGSIPSVHGDELKVAIARLGPIRDRLVRLAELDVDAYTRVIETRQLPRDTPAQHLARHTALQRALREATDVPLDMMQICEEALRYGIVISRHPLARAKGDCAIGLELISVALRSAARAVNANLRRVEDAGYVGRVAEQCRRFEADGTETLKSILRVLDAV